jgi:benzylsuccinate CoA-transferase BbsF subunit
VIGALGALLGLRHRDRSGRGQHVDFSQQEGVAQLIAPAFMDYVMNGRVGGPIGNLHPLGALAPHGVFPCSGEDRWIAIAVSSDEEWKGLAAAMGDPAWTHAADFAEPAVRAQHVDSLHARISEWTRGFDDYELAAMLQRRGVAATPVLGVADLLRDPHFAARGTFREVEHPLGFRETIYGAYVKTSGVEPPIRPGPMMGQDNERVFKGLLGMSDDEYRRLVEEEVIF